MQDPSSYSSLLHITDTSEDGLITLEELRTVKESDFNHHHQHYETSYYDPTSLEDPCSSSGFYKNDLVDALDTRSSVADVTELQEVSHHGSRKRKASLKQNHSEIEKRRRDKMNTYITELSSMIPMCSAMSRKLDKITVLRMAVDYLKTIRGPGHSYTETHYKPPFITDQELKQLILQVAEGFVFVVGCDRGKILYVSESVSKILNFSQNDLLRHSLFDILHPKDVAKVKEQLSSSDHSSRERHISSKISRLCTGARRSFFCRMKCNFLAQMKDKPDKQKESNPERKYAVIHCIGYLKSWAPTKIGLDEQDNDLDGDYNVSCLIAIGRTLPHISSLTSILQNKISMKPIQFISKHTLDGKFLFVDQRVTLILGFLPQELLGCSMYEYFYHEDVPSLTETHKTVLQSMEKCYTKTYRFKTKHGDFVYIQSEWKAFKNPWTKDIEYLISKNNLIIDLETSIETNGHHEQTEKLENVNFMNESNEEKIEFSNRNIANFTGNVVENSNDGMMNLIEDVANSKSQNNKQQSDGNDEAAMAMIMSLLEVDAGLGGPVDFSGLPWPLP